MKKVLKALIYLSMLLLVTKAFALSWPSNLSLEKATDTSLKITWDEVDDSLGYYIYYSEESSTDWTYENEWTDLIDDTSYKIEWLTPDKNYYIAITVDEDWNHETNSEELVCKNFDRVRF